MKTLSMFGVVLFVAVGVAQEGAVVLPGAYQVQFENEWVKVTRVLYGPLEKLPPHAHTPLPSAYVYLADGGPVRFKHIGGHNTVATRPATKAGAFRVYRGLDEVHEVENTSEVVSEFLRVELKTEARSPETFRGKFERPASQTDGGENVQFDHSQVRITRLWALPARSLEISSANDPSLLIALTAGVGFKTGEERWLAPASSMTIENAGQFRVEFLRFDFKTKPLTH